MRRTWIRFALRRTVVLLASLATLVVATFLITHLVPGDPARAGLGPTAKASQVEARRATLRLDEPLPAQLRSYVGGVFTGDLGNSFATGQPVAEIVRDRFPATLRLALATFVVTLLVGLPLGMAMAVLGRGGRHRAAQGAFSFTTGLMISVPDYLIATGLVALFGVALGWLPIAGDEGWTSYVLPVAAFSALSVGMLARMARVEMAGVLDEEYMRVARGKRMPDRVLYLRHALPNALTATLTFSGLILGGCLAGTVVIENVFAWPGLGSAVVQAIQDKDYPLVQAIVLLLGSIVLVVNLAIDVLLGILDPRVLTREEG